MALSILKYPDIFYAKKKNGAKVYGGIRWKDSGQQIEMGGGIPFSLPVNAQSTADPMEEITLFEFSNGVTLKLSYRMIVTPSMNYDTYSLSTRWNYYDKNGIVLLSGGGPGGSRNKFPQDPHNPWEVCYFSTGIAFYNVADPTPDGEEAVQLWASVICDLKHNVLTPAPYSPSQTYGSFTGSYNITAFHVLNTDNDYYTWLSRLIAGGDGSNPGGIDDGGGGGGGEDPAGSDDTSEPGGGDGNYDDDSDPVDFPDLPTGGALECGAIIAHRLVKQTLEVVFGKLWSTAIITGWLKTIQDPMDAIVSLHALPVSPEVDGSTEIVIGNLKMGVTSPEVTSQYVAVDCGYLDLNEFWGSALDYSPYTKVEIYLPFIGFKTLRTEDVMKSRIEVRYHVDVLTGDCVAFVKCGISVLYTYEGNCKMSIPLSARSSDNLQKFITGVALGVAAGGVAVGGGAAAAAATKAPAIAAAGVTQSAANIQSGSMMLSAANSVASTKINVSRSGDVRGSVSLMGDFVPYLVIHRPVQSLAKDYNKFKGYTSNITALLGNLTGYTEVEHVQLSGIPNATDAEIAEIHALLVSGVIL